MSHFEEMSSLCLLKCIPVRTMLHYIHTNTTLCAPLFSSNQSGESGAAAVTKQLHCSICLAHIVMLKTAGRRKWQIRKCNEQH